MRSTKILGLCFIAVLAMSAVVSPSAWAKNPRWAICNEVAAGTGHFTDSQCKNAGTGNFEKKELLSTSETKEISVTAKGAQELKAPTINTTIKCTEVSVKAGAVIRGGEPGTDKESLIYKGCEVEGFPECEVKSAGQLNGTIETEALESKLGYKTEKQEIEENQEDTVTVFKTSAAAFVVIELSPAAKCPLKTAGKFKVTGEVVCENVEGGVHLVSHELHCPKTALTEYWEQTAEQKPHKVEPEKLRLGVAAASYVGQSVIKLSDGQDWWIV
jgi:hypothetical protein